MGAVSTAWLCLLLVVSTLSAVVFEEVRSSCCAAEFVTEGETALVTCSFDKDLTQLKVNFYMDYSAFHSSHYDHIVHCGWRNTSGNFTCKMKYSTWFWNFTSNNQLVVTIPRAQLEHSGRYHCSVFQQNSPRSKECELNVKSVQETSEKSELAMKSTVPTLNTNLSTEDEVLTYTGIGMIAAGILIAAIVFIILFKNLKFSCCS